jgi:hypothetical protein
VVAAGTVTWWDDDRRHATCTTCFDENASATTSPAGPRPTERAERRARLLRIATSA